VERQLTKPMPSLLTKAVHSKRTKPIDAVVAGAAEWEGGDLKAYYCETLMQPTVRP
jgi:hypothetical protein